MLLNILLCIKQNLEQLSIVREQQLKLSMTLAHFRVLRALRIVVTYDVLVQLAWSNHKARYRSTPQKYGNADLAAKVRKPCFPDWARTCESSFTFRSDRHSGSVVALVK